MTTENPYESDQYLAHYLQLHYGERADVLSPDLDLPQALEPLASSFHVRCVQECVDTAQLPTRSRALDIGCAVGRSTFELARYCQSIIGIDASRKFIQAANHLKNDGMLAYGCIEEGLITKPCVARVPEGIDRDRVSFEVGDALDLRDHLGQFDVVVMANLIDRLSDPKRCLERIPGLLNPRGQLIITSPYSVSEEFTPRENWLGGFVRDTKRVETFEALRQILDKDFELRGTSNMPFLLRQHNRLYELVVPHVSLWSRR
jgi:putative 4-mercaptohistidine N1-methyltranferase